MKHRLWIVSLVMFSCNGTGLKTATAESFPKLAPYSAISWKPSVEIGGQWYALLAIDEHSVDDIIRFAKQKYEQRWVKRFSEDLVQVLTEMGHPPGKTVNLTVRSMETGKQEVFKNVPMTRENRAKILNPPARGSDLKDAMDVFQKALDAQWAYRHASDADFNAAIDVLRSKLDKDDSEVELGVELQKIIAMGIDGHSGINFRVQGGGYLPFLIEPIGDRFVAFKPDRSGFLSHNLPYVTAIDGVEVGAWCRAASVLVPKGSPQYVRRHSLRVIRNVDYVRTLLNLPIKDTVRVRLNSADGGSSQTTSIPVASRRPIYGIWPPRPSGYCESDIAYLRLPKMNSDALEEIKTWMPRFHDSSGLIVDVRDNGGGSREALRLLYSYLAAPDDPPRAFTAARYRLFREFDQDHLAKRFMYPKDSQRWNTAERSAIDGFLESFRPQWTPPENQFSPWHYMVLSPLDESGVYHYDKPVAVLLNGKCFSATDIFLAGLKGMKNVTLIGTPSSGGSALSQRVTLGRSGLRMRIASMASFQADGKLFDGNGVQPHVLVNQAPEYFIGGRDEVLETAKSMLVVPQSKESK
ncbi:MAG: hypothetical protein DHS20C16_12800 [Phycisphaerae bacterium]|nr:MAG: hypothetical protein DHS20C16_12800 [Phycisphaerae bacterium]